MIESKKMSRFTKSASVLIWMLCLLLPSMVRAQGASIFGQAITSAGKPAAYATVRVCPYSGGGIPCSPLSSVYSDLALTQPVPNPYTSDNFGNFSIFVSSQTTYIVQLNVGSGITYSYLVTVGGIGGGFTAGGDLSGNSSSQTVIGIRGHLVSATPPTNGQALIWNSSLSEYVPTTPSSAGITELTGPVTATGPGSAVATITPTGVTAGTYPIGGTAITFNAAGQATAVGPPFSASFGCTPCASSPYEIGYTGITSASGTISYANPTLPTSASVSDGTNVDTLTTPFTSWTLSHSYTTNTTFTLTALGDGQTITETQGLAFLPRSYGGTGTGGSATNVVVTGTSAALEGATGTLTNGGLASSSVGQVYNVTTSGTQYVYLLLATNVSNPGGGSFTTPGPTVFAMNAPTTITVTGQYGGTWTGYLYRSVNSFFNGSNFVITVGN